jgi:hypothetical protein
MNATNNETVMWGHRIGDEEWVEHIITTNPAALEKARVWALANGFDRTRVTTFSLSEQPWNVNALVSK